MRGMTTASRRSLVRSTIRGDVVLAILESDPDAAAPGAGAVGWLTRTSALPGCAGRVVGSAGDTATWVGLAGAAALDCGALPTGDGDGGTGPALRANDSFAGPLATSFGVAPGDAGCEGADCEIVADGETAGGVADGATAGDAGAAGDVAGDAAATFCSAATGVCGGDRTDATGAGSRSGCRDAMTDSGTGDAAGVCEGVEGAGAATVAGARNGISVRDATLSEALI